MASLALNEPAWTGNEDLTEAERELWDGYERIMALPPKQMMPEFVRVQLTPGIEPHPRPEGPPPPWMETRPAGLNAFTEAFKTFRLDIERLGAFNRPVLYTIGGRSNLCSTGSRRSVSAESSRTSRLKSSRSGITSIRRTLGPRSERPGLGSDASATGSLSPFESSLVEVGRDDGRVAVRVKSVPVAPSPVGPALTVLGPAEREWVFEQADWKFTGISNGTGRVSEREPGSHPRL